MPLGFTRRKAELEINNKMYVEKYAGLTQEKKNAQLNNLHKAHLFFLSKIDQMIGSLVKTKSIWVIELIEESPPTC